MSTEFPSFPPTSGDRPDSWRAADVTPASEADLPEPSFDVTWPAHARPAPRTAPAESAPGFASSGDDAASGAPSASSSDPAGPDRDPATDAAPAPAAGQEDADDGLVLAPIPNALTNPALASWLEQSEEEGFAQSEPWTKPDAPTEAAGSGAALPSRPTAAGRGAQPTESRQPADQRPQPTDRRSDENQPGGYQPGAPSGYQPGGYQPRSAPGPQQPAPGGYQTPAGGYQPAAGSYSPPGYQPPAATQGAGYPPAQPGYSAAPAPSGAGQPGQQGWGVPPSQAPGGGTPLPGPAGDAPLDVCSAIALPTGLLLGPVGIGFGVAGMARTSKGRRRGRWMALVGTILGLLGTAGLVVGYFLFWRAPDTDPLDSDVSQATTANAMQLVKGNCLENLPGDGEVTSVKVVPCSQEHTAQVVDSKKFTGDFPGEDAAYEDVAAICDGARLDSPEDLRMVVWTPTEKSWQAGDRTGLCIASSDQPLSTDLAGG